jgi:hypothetical protein
MRAHPSRGRPRGCRLRHVVLITTVYKVTLRLGKGYASIGVLPRASDFLRLWAAGHLPRGLTQARPWRSAAMRMRRLIRSSDGR